MSEQEKVELLCNRLTPAALDAPSPSTLDRVFQLRHYIEAGKIVDAALEERAKKALSRWALA